MNKTGLKEIQGILKRDKMYKKFMRITDQFNTDEITANRYLDKLKGGFGKDTFFRMVPILSNCFKKKKRKAIEEAIEALGDQQISKTMTWLLRHKAKKEGLVTVAIVKRIVKNDEKKRYTLEENECGQLKIRANQGHSMKVKKLALKPISSCEVCVHGIPGKDRVISGFRTNAEVLVYVDVAKAVRAGIKFFESANEVILTPGDEKGYLAPKFFKKVVNAKTGEIIRDEF